MTQQDAIKLAVHLLKSGKNAGDTFQNLIDRGDVKDPSAATVAAMDEVNYQAGCQDEFCPCQDGDPCHYESWNGDEPMVTEAATSAVAGRAKVPAEVRR